MLVKIVVIFLFLLVVGSLGSALVYLIQDKGKGERVVKALTFRIGLSLLAFMLLMLGTYLGWIEPHGLRPVP
jgi:uncharacterized membrane protein